MPIGIILALMLGGCSTSGSRFAPSARCVTANSPTARRCSTRSDAVTNEPHLYWIVALGGIAGNATVMLTSLLGQMRIFYVMARDRMLPPGVARIHPRLSHARRA